MKQPVAGGTPLLPSTVHDPPSASKATPRTKGGGTRGSRLVRSPRKDPRSSMKDPRASSYGAISGASNRPLRIGLEVDSNDSDGASMSSISVATGSRRKGKKPSRREIYKTNGISPTAALAASTADHPLLSDYSREYQDSNQDFHERCDSLDSTLTFPKTKTPMPSASGKVIRSDSMGLAYDTNNHYAVMTRMYGSVLPRVWKFILVNVILTLVLVEMQHRGFQVAINDSGHKFMSVLISFLVVSRVNIAYARFMENARLMTDLFRNCRELVMNAMSFTRQFRSEASKDWRLDVCRRVIVLLKVTVSVLEYNQKRETTWTLPMLKRHEQEALLASVGESRERCPILLSMFLRTAISAHESFEVQLNTNEKLRLLQNNTDYVQDYHGLMKLLTTPFPFPLVQMTRTFLFLWVFTLPFALLKDIEHTFIVIFMVASMTFGFVGLEFVAMEMDDPYGADENDLEIYKLSLVVYEDVQLFLFDVDGEEQASLLKKVIEDPSLEMCVKRSYKKHVRNGTLIQGGGFTPPRNEYKNEYTKPPSPSPALPLSPTTAPASGKPKQKRPTLRRRTSDHSAIIRETKRRSSLVTSTSVEDGNIARLIAEIPTPSPPLSRASTTGAIPPRQRTSSDMGNIIREQKVKLTPGPAIPPSPYGHRTVDSMAGGKPQFSPSSSASDSARNLVQNQKANQSPPIGHCPRDSMAGGKPQFSPSSGTSQYATPMDCASKETPQDAGSQYEFIDPFDAINLGNDLLEAAQVELVEDYTSQQEDATGDEEEGHLAGTNFLDF